MKRIQALDGLRGVAILLVLLYHGYYIWSDFYPFGDRYREVFFFKHGNLGVQLFFMISGFVILMSLEKTNSYFHFLLNRWIRLFPAMLIASLLIFATAPMLLERPLGLPPLKALLPGLVFLNPKILAAVFHTDFPPLETSFWTIFLEVKFYIVFGLMFYFLGEHKALWGNALLFLLALGLGWIKESLPFTKSIVGSSFIDTFCQFGWFTAGALTYRYYKDPQKKYLLLFFLLAGLSIFSLFEKLSTGSAFMLIFLIAVFISILLSRIFNKFFSGKFLTFIGFISYALYLIHENMMVAFVSKIYNWFPEIPTLLLPVFAALLPIFLAWIITRWMENPMQKWLKNRLLPLFKSNTN